MNPRRFPPRTTLALGLGVLHPKQPYDALGLGVPHPKQP